MSEALGLGLAGPGGAVLDLCCGFGRHTLALRERGQDAFGVDLSLELLTDSGSLEGGAQLAGRLARADMRALPFRADAFAAVLMLFSSFGYLGEEGDARTLGEIARVLAPGGLAVLDLMNPDRVRAGLVERSTCERAGAVLTEERSLADGGRRVVKEVTLEHPGGNRETWSEDVRMYAADEVAALAQRFGLVPRKVLGGFAGEPYDSGAERQIVVLTLPRG